MQPLGNPLKPAEHPKKPAEHPTKPAGHFIEMNCAIYMIIMRPRVLRELSRTF